MARPHLGPRSTRTTRVLLALAIGVTLLAQVLLYPGIDVLVAAYGADGALRPSMWFLAAEFAGFVALAGAWGAVSDARGERVPLIVAGAAAGAVGYALLAALAADLLPVSVPFGAVVALRFLQGAATIGPFSLAMTMLMDLEGGHGRNMGAAGIAIGLGTAIGAPLGGQLYGHGADVPLWAATGLLAVVAVGSLGLPERAPSAHGDPEGDAPADASSGGHGRARELIVGLRRSPSLLVPYAFGFVDRLTAGFFALVGTLYFRSVFDLDPAATGLMLGLFFAPFALLQYPMGVLSDRVGRTGPVVGGSALYGVGVFAVGHAPAVEHAGVAMVAVGVLGALMAPATMALVSDIAAAGERGVAMAGFNAAGSLGFLAGILAGGMLADALGFGAAFATVGGLEVLVALVAIPALLRLDVEREGMFDR